MSHIYDNWERLVAAAIRKEQLWQLFHEDSRTPSLRSEASSSSRSSSFSDVPYGYSAPYTHRPLPKLSFVTDYSPVFEFQDLLGASAELLGKGTFGNTYTAAMDNGIKIVVKELKEVSMTETEFKRSMEIIGNVKHENIVPLRAYFYSKDEKLMLFDYYKNGSVSTLLHGENGENRANLEWETRLRIALGAARGIAHIHLPRAMKLVHGNIKSSNIFLNSQQYGCVSDFGLTGMTTITSVQQNTRYHAPEIKTTQDMSQASDVYSFGILLLELLTRRSPELDLATWVNSFKRKEWVPKVFDVDLLLKIPNIKDDLVKLLQIAIRCVAKSSKRRPKMSSVVKMIEDIVSATKTSINDVVNTRSLVFFDGDRDHGFDLEDMLGSSAEVLGKGTFGTSYKVRLDGGTIIVGVKRLKDVIVTNRDFEKHMEVLGRIRHNNVGKLIAYYYSRDEKLLVYDYFHDSVSAMLHEIYLTTPDWEARLRIAIGTARGIAHIHKQDNQKLVHGNIKSSNIFLNSQKYGCVADAGLGAVASPVKYPISVPEASAMSYTLYYRAPEVTDTKKVTQESDVYSFGVVLLELVSGKSTLHARSDGKVVSLVEWIEQSVFRDEWSDEVYDKELLRYDGDRVAMSQVLHIALDCVVCVPEHRPKMSEVAKLLEEVSGMDAEEDAVPTVTRLEDFLPKLTLEL